MQNPNPLGLCLFVLLPKTIDYYGYGYGGDMDYAADKANMGIIIVFCTILVFNLILDQAIRCGRCDGDEPKDARVIPKQDDMLLEAFKKQLKEMQELHVKQLDEIMKLYTR